MVIFDFVQRSLVVEMNRVLEAKENVMALHVLNRLYKVDWDSSILTDGDEQPMERLHYWIWKFGVPEWDNFESESWFYSWRKWRKEKRNNFEPGES